MGDGRFSGIALALLAATMGCGGESPSEAVQSTDPGGVHPGGDGGGSSGGSGGTSGAIALTNVEPREARLEGGEKITLRGSRLDDGSGLVKVTIGDKDAKVLRASTDVLDVELPAGSNTGSVDVVVSACSRRSVRPASRAASTDDAQNRSSAHGGLRADPRRARP